MKQQRLTPERISDYAMRAEGHATQPPDPKSTAGAEDD